MPDEKRQILDRLSPAAPRERHQAVREHRVDGVGNWLLGTTEFHKWHTGEDQAVNPVLFCYGDPGVGKTYLSSLVIDTLCDVFDGGNVVVACIYCDFHANKEQSATRILAALLKQLIAGVEPIPEVIKEAFDRAKKKVDGRTLRLPDVLTMLTKTVSSLQRGFTCVDGLDEFPTKHRPELWNSLQHIVRGCPNIQLFATGRPHIQEEVKHGHSERSSNIGAARPLSEPRTFTHNPSQTGGPTLKSPSTTPSAQGVKPVIPNINETAETAPSPPPPDQSPLNQPQAHPPTFAPTPIPTSYAHPDSTTSQHSRPLIGCTTPIRQIFCHVKGKLSPSSQHPP